MKHIACPVSKDMGIQDEEERVDLIEFLKVFSKNMSLSIVNNSIKLYGQEYVDA